MSESNILSLVFSFVATVIFSLVIIYSFKISLYTRKYKTLILSLFGGIVAAYVFLDLLPSIVLSGQFLNELGSQLLVSIYEDSIFLLVFTGFLIFFTLEYFAANSAKKHAPEDTNKEGASGKKLFIVHFLMLSILDFALSFSLFFEFNASIVGGLLYAFAISLHLFIADNSMVEHYKDKHTKDGRYIAASIPIIAWVFSVVFPERIAEAYVLLAFVSGSILFQSIKDEIPAVKNRRSLWLFLAGAGVYAGILILYSILSA